MNISNSVFYFRSDPVVAERIISGMPLFSQCPSYCYTDHGFTEVVGAEGEVVTKYCVKIQGDDEEVLHAMEAALVSALFDAEMAEQQAWYDYEDAVLAEWIEDGYHGPRPEVGKVRFERLAWYK